MIHPMDAYPESIRKLYPILPPITKQNLLDFIENKNEEAFLFYLNNYNLEEEPILKKAISIIIEQSWTSVYPTLIQKLSRNRMAFFIDDNCNIEHINIFFNEKNPYYQQILDIHGEPLLAELQQLQLRRIFINSNSQEEKLQLCIPNIKKGKHDSVIQGQITNIFKETQTLLPVHQVLTLVEQEWINPFVILESMAKYKKNEFSHYEQQLWKELENHIIKKPNDWNNMMAKASITQVFFPDYPELVHLIENLPIPKTLEVEPVKNAYFLYHKMLFNFENVDSNINTFLSKQIKNKSEKTISGHEVIEYLFALETQEQNDDIKEILISKEKIKQMNEIQIKKELKEISRPSTKPSIRF